MTDQYTQRTAYQCKQCGQILLTEQGMEQHKHKCHYAPPVIEGQMEIKEVQENV